MQGHVTVRARELFGLPDNSVSGRRHRSTTIRKRVIFPP